MADLVDLVALSFLPSPLWRRAAEALRAGDSAFTVLERLCDARPHPHADSHALRVRASAAIDRGQRAGLLALPWTDAVYPAALASLVDPPFVLWTRGSTDVWSRPAVAVVGSRAASEYGLAVASRLGADLAGRGVVVVSGLARGIDGAAHRGALGAVERGTLRSGVTIAVLGSGADVLYPAEHQALAHDIACAGAVVSELAPGTPPLKPFFPLRNRIISGLSRAVVVVEAGDKSGSLITARCAVGYGRDVAAVPGSVLAPGASGSNALLKDGAILVRSADDLLAELPDEDRRRLTRPVDARDAARLPDLPPDAAALLRALDPDDPRDADALIALARLDAPRFSAALFHLEIEGLATALPGALFVRARTRG